MKRAKWKKSGNAARVEDVRPRELAGPKSKRGGGRIRSSDVSLDRTELVSAACRMFCCGLKASEIRDRIKTEFGVSMTREVPYLLIGRAAAQGWIRYTPPAQFAVEEKIRQRYPRLQGLTVVHAAMAEDVANAGARALLRMLQQHYADSEVHIGFSGGHAMRMVARHLAELLREPSEALPKKIVFHALVAGFDLYDPTTAPNSFFTYFVSDPGLQVETAFVGLHAPPIISPKHVADVMALEPIRLARKQIDKLDIIMTSASPAKDEHNALRLYMHIPEDELKKAKCVGDILWQPLGPDGPIDLRSSVRALTLVDLKELQSFVAGGRRVVLVAGPCGSCHLPKAGIVEAVLRQERPLITDLVTDSRCASELLNGAREQ